MAIFFLKSLPRQARIRACLLKNAGKTSEVTREAASNAPYRKVLTKARKCMRATGAMALTFTASWLLQSAAMASMLSDVGFSTDAESMHTTATSKKRTLQGLTQKDLEAFFADGGAATKKIILESFAEASKCALEEQYVHHRKIGDEVGFFQSLPQQDKKNLVSQLLGNYGIRKVGELFRKLPSLTDKKTMLQGMKRKDLEDFFEDVGPATKNLILEVLPEKMTSAFERQLKKAAYIRENYNRIDKDYSVNFMWVYKDLSAAKSNRYVFPAKYLENILKWGGINDSINVWYDSSLVTDEMIKETDRALIGKTNIHLKDIRSLALVKNHENVFSKNNKDKFTGYLPVYFRADLLRAIVSYEMVKKTDEYFVYADMDMNPTSKKDLFDPTTLYNLKKFGMVLAHGGHHGFENGFQIIGNHQENLLEAMKTALIDVNIKRGENAISEGYYPNSNNRMQENRMEPLQQIVYDSYPDAFKFFYYKQGWIDLSLYGKKYNDEKDLMLFRTFGGSTFNLGVWEVREADLKGGWRDVMTPTKEVDLGPAGLQY